MSKLASFFNPAAIAVVGASRDSEKIGQIILGRLIQANYRGKIYPVNPNADTILNLPCYKSVLDIPGKVDLALISIPGDLVDEVLAECGQKGIKNVVVVSAGFAEGGNVDAEVKLTEIAEKFKINLLGPNCLGFFNTETNLDLTFAGTKLQKGPIGLISASGAVGTGFLDWAASNNIGLKKFVSLGNKAALNENDFLADFSEDKEIEIIMLYLESFADGAKFVELAREISKTKTIIVLRPGSSQQAKTALASHTGAIAGDDKIINAALERSGCIVVRTIEELFNLAKVISFQPKLKGKRIVVVTNAGGIGLQAVDDLGNNGLDPVHLSSALQKELKKHLPKEASVANPVDILGDAKADRYQFALEKVIASNEIDGIMVILTPQTVTESLSTAKFVNQLADKHKKTVVTSFVGGTAIKEAVSFLNQERIPQFSFPNDAARTLALLSELKVISKNDEIESAHKIVNHSLNNKIAENGMVDLAAARELFARFHLPLIVSSICKTWEEVSAAAKKQNYPVVIKLVHATLIHKTEQNVVRLNIEDEAKLKEEFTSLVTVAKNLNLKNYQFEVQPFIKDKFELIIGVKKDEDKYRELKDGRKFLRTKGFGHFLLFGSGGIYSEVFDDIALELLPINHKQAEELIAKTKAGEILQGARGQKYNLSGVVNVLLNLSKLIERNHNIYELDINPLFVTSDNVYANDIKLFARPV